MEKIFDRIFELPLVWQFLVIVVILFIFVWVGSRFLTNMFWGALPWDDEGARKNIKENVVDPLLKKDED